MATPKLIPGILADFEKKSTLGTLAKLNLNPVAERKFRFAICFPKAPVISFIFI
jgi:hypothetical protein